MSKQKKVTATGLPKRKIRIIYDGCFTSSAKELVKSEKFQKDKSLAKQLLATS